MLDLNSDLMIDMHGGDMRVGVQMTANTFVRITARLENQIDPTNSSAFHNVLDRSNHLFKIVCGEKNLDPKTKFAIK